MNVIFCDVDGVLTSSKWSWDDLAHYGEHEDDENYIPVNPEKLEILKKICDETNAKLVLSSSWKLGYRWYDGIRGSLYQLIKAFYDYGIDFIGFTPNIPREDHGNGGDMWKEWDIACYLYEHPEVENFCILDDERYDLETMSDYLVETKFKINEAGDGGIMLEQLDDVKKKMLNSSSYKR